MSGSTGLSSDISLAHDPYEMMLKEEKFNKNLIPLNASTRYSRTWNKMKNKFEGAKDNMIQGAIMGFMVGGLFGFAVGCYSAIHTRRFMAIPISTVVSGASFSFILGCGSMIRTDQIRPSDPEQLQEGQWLSIYNFNNRVQEVVGK